MTPQNSLSRRDVLKVLGAGAGAALLGLKASSAAEAPGATPAPNGPLTQPFTLPPLGYAYDALEPHIDARTMEIHHDKHHRAYIDNANKALAPHPTLQGLTAEQILTELGAVPEAVRAALRNNVGGHVNHTFFWQAIAPGGSGGPGGALAAAIDGTFGSLASLQKQFNEAAMKRFGSGWAWLGVGKDGKLAVSSTANQDSLLSEGARPVLGLDVWEHAYYLKYQNRRAEYVAAFWTVVNWRRAEECYAFQKT
jgi:Fe-Mn family superoxide dismutase